jgi:hypothetical protein
VFERYIQVANIRGAKGNLKQGLIEKMPKKGSLKNYWTAAWSRSPPEVQELIRADWMKR